MPIAKGETWTRYPAISLRGWKHNEMKTLIFLDEGEDVEVSYGLAYLYHVQMGKETYELWIAPNSPLAIALAPYVPLKGKTFEISKTTGKQRKDTRYHATPKS